jgi:hypothetical protein
MGTSVKDMDQNNGRVGKLPRVTIKCFNIVVHFSGMMDG